MTVMSNQLASCENDAMMAKVAHSLKIKFFKVKVVHVHQLLVSVASFLVFGIKIFFFSSCYTIPGRKDLQPLVD